MSNITRLRRFIAEKKLPAIERILAQSFSWKHAHEDGEGLLYMLFPEHTSNLIGYDANFSKQCLTTFIRYGYDPSEDDDGFRDFYTECHRKCFRDFAEVMRKQELKTQMDVLQSFLAHSLAFYDDHLEHLVTPTLAQGVCEGHTAMEHIWKNFVLDREYICNSGELMNHYVCVSERLLDEGFDLINHQTSVMPLLENAEEAATSNAEDGQRLINFVRTCRAMVEKCMLTEVVAQHNKDTTFQVPKKM